MPTGYVCDCGRLTKDPSGKCTACRTEQHARAVARRQVYDDPRWHRCRRLAWLRDGWACQHCGRIDAGNAGRTLDGHHVRPVLELVAEGKQFDVDLVETLCKSCHGKT